MTDRPGAIVSERLRTGPTCDDGPVAAPLCFDTLRAAALANGIDAVGACDAAPFPAAREALEERRAAGLNGSMQFTYRNPGRCTDPSRTLEGAATLLVGATSYHRARPEPKPAAGPVARTARYVWADDQERLIAGLEAMAGLVREARFRAIVITDQNNLVDRAVAHRAGLGWFGKNANLLLPGQGSWFILGSVLTDAGTTDIAEFPSIGPTPDGCGTCERCLPACPTGAIVAPGVVDARRCLSWTLQDVGSFPRDQRVALGDRIYGCDDCQEVCPPNRVQTLRRQGDQVEQPLRTGDPDRAWVSVCDLLASSDQDLLDRHGRWYIARRDPVHLRRNALVVLGNVGDPSDPAVTGALRAALAHPSALVRAHAVWAARRLGCDDLLSMVQHDPDSEVQDELTAEVTPRFAPEGQAT